VEGLALHRPRDVSGGLVADVSWPVTLLARREGGLSRQLAFLEGRWP
jgi:hypothetical protein